MCQHLHHGRHSNRHDVAAACKRRGRLVVDLLAISCLLLPIASGHAATLTLEDTRTLEGSFNYVSGVADDPLNPPVGPGRDLKLILVLDDGLRRTYVPRRHVIHTDAGDQQLAKIHVEQQVANVGRPVAVVGAPAKIEPFDQYGRRIYEMVTTDGLLPVIQGITEITPVYTRVEGLLALDQPIVWDMRVATSSIPRETLSAILKRSIPQDDLSARLAIVQLYLQSQRHRDARLELEQILQDFPGQEVLEREVRELRQIGARRALDEIQLRADAGQHVYVQSLLAQFPAEEVAGETLVQVRQMLADYAERQEQIDAVREQLNALAKSLAADARAQRITSAVQEISSELSHNTIGHLEAFRQLGGDQLGGGGVEDGEQMALALSGWLLGTGSAVDNLGVAVSLWEVRDLVRAYLREPLKIQRDQILADLRTKEGASVEQVARILARMNPPLDPPTPADPRVAGFYELSVPGLAENADVRYLVQLPPEYDPNRRYPTIVTLNGAGSTPEMQLDFWAGGLAWQQDRGLAHFAESSEQNVPVPLAAANGPENARRGERIGQGMRYGYITVAVDWQKPHQLHYEYSAREHHAVLSALRDVCRHFSVDTDRVFLTGHDTGGDAAWDIALAHPDLWAGALPIVATSDRYVVHYWPNARYVPLYFVAGELDGTRIKENARDWDRYLRGGFDATLVEYLGRGHEAFHDEIQRMFDWMNRRRRDFAVREFECSTMRPWDNFFWWLEASSLPPRSMVQPALWPPPRNTRPLALKGRIYDTGKVSVEARGGSAVVWLSPDLVDFTKPLVVEIGGRKAIGRANPVEPDLAVLLEDARTRADRQHPFWAKVE